MLGSGGRQGTRRGAARARALLSALALLAILTPGAAQADHAKHGEVDPATDNPPGCETATSETDDGCGAQGRDHFANPGHQPPIEACADHERSSGSRITRILPDGPRRADVSPAFQTGACVYLPPGYATSGLRHPVVYLLHGGGGDQADWLNFGAAADVLDRFVAADPSLAVIAVMPDGRSGQWYDYEDRSFLIETYVLDHLVPYVDEHFRTIADRRGRAIAGLSNGGYGAVHLAAKRPDMFVAAGGMSSNIGARTLSGLGPEGEVHYQGSVPYQLAQNLDEVDVILDLGATCMSDVTVDLCATIIIDVLFRPDHLAFVQRMEDVGHKGTLDYRETEGSHAWRWWTKWLEERHLPFIYERLARRQAATAPPIVSALPAEFRYRSIAPAFSVWGYDISVTREAREFLDLRGVTASGFEIQGSGSAVVTTAGRYTPGGAYVVTGTGAGPRTITADGDGRLTVAVDLGPSHSNDQFTEQADLAEATSDYFVIRRVGIAPTEASSLWSPGVAGQPFTAIPAGSYGGTTDAISSPAGGATSPTADGGSTTDPGADEAGLLAAPRGISLEREPQLVPTLLFVLALAGGSAWWWRRRRQQSPEVI